MKTTKTRNKKLQCINFIINGNLMDSNIPNTNELFKWNEKGLF